MNTAWSLASVFLAALGVSLAIIPLCKKLAFRYDYVARPRDDRWHRAPTALLGGVAIGLALFIVVIGAGRASSLTVLMGGAAAIFVVGLVDDLITLKPSTKLIAQIALASALLFFDYRLNWLDSITGDTLLTLLWVVGI